MVITKDTLEEYINEVMRGEEVCDDDVALEYCADTEAGRATTSYSNGTIESFEIEVDEENNISVSGKIKVDFDIKSYFWDGDWDDHGGWKELEEYSATETASFCLSVCKGEYADDLELDL